MTRTKWFHRGCQIVGWMLIAALVFNNIWYLTRPQVELWVVITNAVGLFLGLGLAMEIQYPGMLNRAGRLITGKYTWVDEQDGSEETDHYDWHTRWRISGPRVWSWWWVRRYGEQPCGCRINPITRKYTSYAWECPEHGITAISDRRAQLDKKEEGNAND